MMQENKNLQTILDEMFSTENSFSFDVVREWQNRYPQFKKEIAEAVSDWREFEFFALEDAETIESSELSETARNAMEKALAQFRRDFDETITDLRETAENKGVGRETLIKFIGASETLMRKIERRNIEVPQKIQAKIGEMLQVSLNSLQTFFALPAMLPKTARYKSRNAPQTQPKQPFVEAVYNDPELSLEEKKKLVDSVKE